MLTKILHEEGWTQYSANVREQKSIILGLKSNKRCKQVEFANGLLAEVTDKLMDDIEKKKHDDDVFWMALNETLDFEQVLNTLFPTQPQRLSRRPIHIFVDISPNFEKWMLLEATCTCFVYLFNVSTNIASYQILGSILKILSNLTPRGMLSILASL